MAMEKVDTILYGGTVVTMNAAVRPDPGWRGCDSAGRILSPLGRAPMCWRSIESDNAGRLRRRLHPARAGQRPYPRPDDAAARAGGRSAAGRVAARLHHADRARIRQPGVLPPGDEPRLRRNDPQRHHQLRRYVLLRGRHCRSDRRGGDARRAGAVDPQIPRAGRRQLRGKPRLLPRLHREVARSSADYARRRAARALLEHRRDAQALRRIWRASSTCRC